MATPPEPIVTPPTGGAGTQLNEHGYPDATPVADMATEHQAAYWKHFARKHEARANAAPTADELEALRTAAAELATRKAFELTETQRAQAEKDAAETARITAERERDTARTDLLRLTVAADKGLTTAQAGRLQGSTKEELEADADALKAMFGTTAPVGPQRPVHQHGGSAPRPSTSVSDGEARYKAQHGTN